ncbi:MAG: hypothetical protein HY426_01825 [Candidatus Levybacteria bacterium]|nr:hypothetical protein [Candidatus Levybacteria bacterium]
MVNELTSYQSQPTLENGGRYFMPDAARNTEGNINAVPQTDQPETPAARQAVPVQAEEIQRREEGERTNEQRPEQQPQNQEQTVPVEPRRQTLTREARDYLNRIGDRIPDRIDQNLERILRENGISQEDIDRNRGNPRVLIDQLRRRFVPEGLQMDADTRATAAALNELDRILQQENVRTILESPNPDFNNLPELKEWIERNANPSSRDYLRLVSRLINPQGVNISKESKKLLFEWMTEEIIGLPELSPESHYNIGGYVARDNVTGLQSSSRDLGDEFARYLNSLIEVRQMAHELRRNLDNQEEYKKFVGAGLKAQGLDFMRNKIVGAREVLALYESFTAQKVAERKEWLNNGDLEDVDNQVKNVLRTMQTQKKLKKTIKEGEEFFERPLTDWEIERALSIGKTFFAGTQRFAMYSSLGNIPPGSADRVGSLPYEYIVRTIATFKLAGARYFASAPGPKEFLKKILGNLKRDKNAASNDKTLFGIGENAWLVNGLGALDMESHGWRSQLMFLGDVKIRVNGEEIILLQYLDEVTRRISVKNDVGYDSALGFEAADEAKKNKIRKEVAGEIEKIALGQELYISSLIKHTGELVPGDLKKKLWVKRAVFDPMGIAAMRPDVLKNLSANERTIWDALTRGYELDESGNIRKDADGKPIRKASKIGIANLARLNKEGGKYFQTDEEGRIVRVTRDSSDLERNAQEFLNALDTKEEVDSHGKKKLVVAGVKEEYKYKFINEYFGEEYGNTLSDPEKVVLKKVLDEAVLASNYLSEAKLPFSFLANDIPHAAIEQTGESYAGLGTENIARILGSDQANLVEGFGEMNGLVENPVKGSAERFSKAVEAIARVHSRDGAQKYMEPFIKSWLEMAQIYNGAKWGELLYRLTRKPTSEMEKYWASSNISYDEADANDYLISLARNGIISSDISKGLSESQLERLRKELKADRGANLKRIARYLILMMGPLLGIAIVRALFPKEITEGLGIKNK